MALKLIIVGLRRSSTTIFWSTFRQDPELLCYDEPFIMHMDKLFVRDWLKYPDEFRRLVDQNPLDFWERYAQIPFAEELREGLSDRQADYLRWLGTTAEHVVIDTTRCQFKIAALYEVAPQAVLVHLYRPPASHASSHMLPSGPGLRQRFRKLRDRRKFWTRADNFDGWHFESIIGPSTQSLFAHRLREIGLDPQQVYELPAVGKLLAYWRVCFERVERDGARYYGGQFDSLNADQFCRDPQTTLASVYEKMGLAMPELDLSRIHAPNRPYQAESPRWRHYAELLGLPRV
jgi:hypothetical protein